MKTQLIKINLLMLVLLLEVLSANLIGAVKAHSPFIPTDTADDIVGEWMDDEKSKRIKITKNGTVYEGTITNAAKTELIGKKIITGLVYAEGVYTGKIYLPKRDTYLDCTATMKDKNTLILKGSAGFVSKETTWTRLK